MRIKRKIIPIFTLLLFLMQFLTFSVHAEELLSLNKSNPEINHTFIVNDMMPGDVKIEDYSVDVSYIGVLDVYFTVDVRQGYEKLAEVLKCRISVPTGEVLYDGLISGVPDISRRIVSTKKITETLDYTVFVYLETSVGNEYQDLELIADFRWFVYKSNADGGGGTRPIKPESSVESTETPESSVPTAESSNESEVTSTPELDFTEESEEVKETGTLIDSPKTGDMAKPMLWCVLIIISLAGLLFFLLSGKKEDEERKKMSFEKKLTVCIIAIVILGICLCITTFALVYTSVSVEENIFRTGTVELNLNDEKPIIEADEFIFEPGMTVKKEFFIENRSRDRNGVWYKIYFDNTYGALASVMDVKIIENSSNMILFDGKAEDLTRENSTPSDLLPNEKRTLTAIFHYPEHSNNSTQNTLLSFEMCAVASQKSNNTNKEF